MSITRKLIRALGGSVRVESVYGEGSTFSVALPLQVSPRRAGDVLRAEIPAAEGAWAGSGTTASSTTARATETK